MPGAVAILAISVALLLVLPHWAHAQPPATLEVASGDRIAGDVRQLEHGVLAFRTSVGAERRWAGIISVVWTEVVVLTTTESFDVELTSGERFFGPISSPSRGYMVVDTASGPSRPIALGDVVRISRVEATFRGRLTGSIDFGLSYMLAGNARTYALDVGASHRTMSYQSRASFHSWLSARDEAERQTRNHLAFDSRRLLPSRWFAVALAEAQQNEAMRLDLRAIVGGGAGRAVVQSNSNVLTLAGGVDYAQERYAGAGSTDHAAEAFGSVEWNWFADGTTSAAVRGTTYASLARERVRFEMNANVRRDVFWSLYWSLNMFESFDSAPPGGRTRSDLGVSISLGRSF